MNLLYYVVNAFSAGPFSGNPAGVCPLEKWLPDEAIQRIAAENNLSETAFFVPEGGGYRLRWFTPATEVDLCGHATLAAAFVAYEFLRCAAPSLRFDTKSGPLSVARDGDSLEMDFPALGLSSAPIAPDLTEGLGAMPQVAFLSMDTVAVFDNEDAVRALRPRPEVLKRLEGRGVIATAPGRTCDYVLRFFGPKAGIPEDPATGSAQSLLAPYWAQKWGKNRLTVRQLSARGGEMACRVEGGRVFISGRAVLYLKGEISL